ncbi:MAG: hypothetical protein WKG07_15415 [Hymenobacter sp.]
MKLPLAAHYLHSGRRKPGELAPLASLPTALRRLGSLRWGRRQGGWYWWRASLGLCAAGRVLRGAPRAQPQWILAAPARPPAAGRCPRLRRAGRGGGGACS